MGIAKFEQQENGALGVFLFHQTDKMPGASVQINMLGRTNNPMNEPFGNT
jgi:hypothetical protein